MTGVQTCALPISLEDELEDVEVLDTTDELPDWIEEEADEEQTEEIVEFTELTKEILTAEEPTPQVEVPAPPLEPATGDEESDDDKFIDLTDTFPTEE